MKTLQYLIPMIIGAIGFLILGFGSLMAFPEWGGEINTLIFGITGEDFQQIGLILMISGFLSWISTFSTEKLDRRHRR